MVIGVLPIGLKGQRDLECPKELLKISKDRDFQIKYLVQKMLVGGCSKVCIVVAHRYIQRVTHFVEVNFKYQPVECIPDAMNYPTIASLVGNLVKKVTKLADEIIIGFGDSEFEGNPIPQLIVTPAPAVVAFTYDDRDVSPEKLDTQFLKLRNLPAEQRCWGLLKLGKCSASQAFLSDCLGDELGYRVGKLVSKHSFNVVLGGDYVDTGTELGRAIAKNKGPQHQGFEHELKLDASDVSLEEFEEKLQEAFECREIVRVSGVDYYFSPSRELDAGKLEFVRLRTNDQSPQSDITIKDTAAVGSSTRFELELPIGESSLDVKLGMLFALGLEFEIAIHKDCVIYIFDDAVLVFYAAHNCNRPAKVVKFIEIEARNVRPSLVYSKYLSILQRELPVVNQSKYRFFKELLE